MHAAAPVQGQLVEVRRRRFVVEQVLESDLQIDWIAKTDGECEHLVTLSSVEDDGLGEELQVIWEIEPGARVLHESSLPDVTGFDHPRRLDAFLHAVRWGAVTDADHRNLHAPFRSGIAIEDYQLDPVVRALQMPRVNLLIADDVGLGKTIESGLVVQEMLLRHRARSVLVVCPAGLQVQWRDQMRDKFGLEFRIVDSGMMKELRRKRGLFVNPWTHFPRLITSIDFLKRERPMRLMREVLPADGEAAFPRKFDLLIVDEAHNVAPLGTGRYAVDSMRTSAIRALAPHFEHKLFLSATPHNGHSASFSALLELLDNRRFHRGVDPDKQQLDAIMVRRLKSELPPGWDGQPRFPKRCLEAIEVPYTDEERRIHQALKRYTELRKESAKDDSTERCATEFVMKLLKKRLFSSPAAFYSTLEKHKASLDSAVKAKKKPKRTGRTLTVLKRHIEGVEEDYADDDAYEESTSEVIDESSRLFSALSEEEEALLEEMRAWAKKAADRTDVKAKRFVSWMKKAVKPEGKWGTARVIVFTEYKATLNYLLGVLAQANLTGGKRVEQLYGGMKTEDREKVKAAFQASPDAAEVRILLATDAASEGIDLQNHCNLMVHYEIPWNPNRLEQRNGRIDRHGQRQKQVFVHHFVGKGYDATRPDAGTKPGDLEGDLEFLMVAANKVETIREDLGKVGPVIAEQVQQAMLGDRKRLETKAAEAQAQAPKKLLKVEREIRDEISRLRQALRDSRNDLSLSAANIQHVVETALSLSDQPALRPVKVDGVDAFRLPPLSGSWAEASIGLKHPHTQKVRPIVFDHDAARGRDDVVLAHLNHRLVQMSLRLMRAEIWQPAESRSLRRVTARLAPSSALETPALIAHARLVVLGADNTRLHEEIIAAGGRLKEGRFARLNVGQVKEALSAATEREPSESMRARLIELWPAHKDALQRSLDARMKERTKNMASSLEARAEKEANDVNLVLTELAKNLSAELQEKPPEQLDWLKTETEQYERDRSSIAARIDSIPAEIERETAAIRARYTEPVARLFPVSVTFVVPENLDEGVR